MKHLLTGWNVALVVITVALLVASVRCYAMKELSLAVLLGLGFITSLILTIGKVVIARE